VHDLQELRVQEDQQWQAVTRIGAYDRTAQRLRTDMKGNNFWHALCQDRTWGRGVGTVRRWQPQKQLAEALHRGINQCPLAQEIPKAACSPAHTCDKYQRRWYFEKKKLETVSQSVSLLNRVCEHAP
jgi:hypothetical protein